MMDIGRVDGVLAIQWDNEKSSDLHGSTWPSEVRLLITTEGDTMPAQEYERVNGESFGDEAEFAYCCTISGRYWQLGSNCNQGSA